MPITSSPSLLPCPFCGGEKFRVKQSTKLLVQCLECWALAPMEVWNRTVPRDDGHKEGELH